MAMDGFTKDMNIIQQLNDEPNDRDGLTAGELKAKFDEGGLALKDYLNNTVKPYVEGMEGTEAAHEADTVRHITAAERTAWNGKYDKTGGVLTGNVTVQPTGAPMLTLSAPEKSGTGRSRTILQKNASGSADYGTQLVDYVWGDGSTANQRTTLRLQCAAALAERLMLIDYAAGGSYVLYHLFGEHNLPAVANITGLQAALDGKVDKVTGKGLSANDYTNAEKNKLAGIAAGAQVNSITGVKGNAESSYRTGNVNLTPANIGAAAASHTHGAGDINSGTLNAARLPAATASTQGAVKLGASGGAAAYSHTHGAGAIASGTLDADRLPTVPISKGGTGATGTLAAITALGGLSALDYGTLLTANSSINTLLTPGTYYCNTAAIAVTITGAPVTEAGFRLFVMVGHNTQTVVQMANVNAKLYIRSTANQGSTWTDWGQFSKVGHVHNASDLTAGTLDAARLPAATGTTRGAVTLGASGGAAAYNHTHNIAGVTGLQDALDGKSDTGHTHNYLPLSGGTLTGDVTVQKNIPRVTFATEEKANVGRARMILYKNASVTADNGTQLADYVWGDGGAATNKNARLVLRSASTSLPDMLTLNVNEGTGASTIVYKLYGEHNKPSAEDIVDGILPTARGGTGNNSGYVTAGQKSGTTLGTKATAEGNDTTASGNYSHAEGNGTSVAALAHYGHAEGLNTYVSGNAAHAEGKDTSASGLYAHAEGEGTSASDYAQHVFGMYNVDTGGCVEVVGGGTSATHKNIRTLDWNGNEWIAGTLTQASDARLKDIQGEVPDVSGIRAVRFKWNDRKGTHDEKDHIGYIAQEVEAVAPYLVGEDSNGYKSLDYIALLCAKVETLERQVRELTEALGGK